MICVSTSFFSYTRISCSGLDFDGYEAEIAALRREGLTRDLHGDAVERFFALGFALDQSAISGTSNSV